MLRLIDIGSQLDITVAILVNGYNNLNVFITRKSQKIQLIFCYQSGQKE